MNSQRSRDLNELKKEALAFYAMNEEVPKKLEEALNSLFYDSPYDLFGYLSDYFVQYSKPAFITQIVANKNVFYDSRSQPMFRLEVFCQYQNKEKKILSIDSIAHSPDLVNDSARIQYIQEDDNYRLSKFQEVIHFINTEISSLAKNYSPFDQDELDEKLKHLFQTKNSTALQSFIFSSKFNENNKIDIAPSISKSPTTPTAKGKGKGKASASATALNTTLTSSGNIEEIQNYFQSNYFGSFVESLTSKAICLAAVSLTKREAFEYISELRPKRDSKYKLPRPLITVLQNGKGFLGKQSLIKEFILMPKQNAKISESSEKISKINRFIRDQLYQSKTQPGAVNKCVTDTLGAFTCLLETPQLGLDMIENAINSVCGEGNSTDIEMAINVAAAELFDLEKNKYEIGLGTLKSGDELIDVYIDLIAKYPRITLIIEPFNTNDPLIWYKLNARISKQCLVANNLKLGEPISSNSFEKTLDAAYNQPSTEASKQSSQNKLLMPLNLLKFENSATVSSLSQKIKEIEDKKLLTGISCSYNESEDTFLTDLAVANQVEYFKIGGLNRAERVNKLNRLIEIESYLTDKNMLNNEVSDIENFRQIQLEIPSEFSELVQGYSQANEDKHGGKNSTKPK